MAAQSRKPILFGESKGPANKKFPFLFIFLLLLAFAACLGTAASVRFLQQMYKTIPGPEEISRIEPSLVTRLYGLDGSLVHEFAVERRLWVPLDSIPQNLKDALIAIEDRRFYDHHGIDLKRILGAALANVLSVGIAQGGSTITQQLARNVYLTHDQTITRKVREILTALKLESCYTKDEILELYLNMVYLGAGSYGVEAAAQRYFSKNVWDLSLPECATLAGAIQRPEGYRPDRAKNIKNVTERRNTVLHAMYRMGSISKDELGPAITGPVVAVPNRIEGNRAAYFVEMVRQYIEKRYGEDLLYNGGLSIYTTLDPVAQDSADLAAATLLKPVQRHCKGIFLDNSKAHKALGMKKEEYMAKFDSLYEAHRAEYKDLPDSSRYRQVQTSIVALDVQSGAIRVMTGGRNYEESKFNRATQAMRQPGSAFKPFVYSAALENGFNPSTVIVDQPISIETTEGLWQPDNYEKEFNGPMSIRDALKKSINSVAIQTLLDVGAEKVVEYARRAGLKGQIVPVPSIAIGSCEATNMEMTRAYSVYPGQGFMAETYFIDRVVDKSGRVLEAHKDKKSFICSPRVAYMMTSMLQTVVRHGTAATIAGLGFTRPAGGKTGTTNSYADAWFVGFTPQNVCGVWVGVDERRSMGAGTTGTFAAIPLWIPVMKALHRDLPLRDFSVPEGITFLNTCKETHKIATAQCPVPFPDCFDVDKLPTDTCDLHGPKKSGGFLHSIFGGPGDEKKEDLKKEEVKKEELKREESKKVELKRDEGKKEKEKEKEKEFLRESSKQAPKAEKKRLIF